MNPQIRDLTGMRTGSLLVVDFAETIKNAAWWNVLCDCGRKCTKRGASLTSKRKRLKSCGDSCPFHSNKGSRTHGGWNHPLYVVWYNMKARCNNPKNTAYKNYGGRGINVCERWMDFNNFILDMAESYKEGLQLDRANNDLGYYVENCRWTTPRRNSTNRRNSLMSMEQIDLAISNGIPLRTVRNRIQRGWGIERAITLPPIKCNLTKQK